MTTSGQGTRHRLKGEPPYTRGPWLPGSSARRARRTVLAAFVLGGAMWLGAAPSGAAEQVGALQKSVAVDGQRVLAIDVSVGTVSIEAGTADLVTVEAELLCSRFNRRCRRQAERLELDVDARSAAIAVDLRGLPRNGLGGVPQVDLRIQAPPGMDVAVSMGVGEVTVAGLDADVDVDLGVGKVLVALDRQQASRVYLEVGVGLATIDPSQGVSRRSGFLLFGNAVRWREGDGNAEVTVDLGVGQAHVSLE